MEKCPSWQDSRAQLTSYRTGGGSRKKRLGPSWHIIAREALEYSWEELFAQSCGALRRGVLDAFDRYLNCGNLRHGCARACGRFGGLRLSLFPSVLGPLQLGSLAVD